MELFDDMTKNLLSLSRGDVSLFTDLTKAFVDRMGAGNVTGTAAQFVTTEEAKAQNAAPRVTPRS